MFIFLMFITCRVTFNSYLTWQNLIGLSTIDRRHQNKQLNIYSYLIGSFAVKNESDPKPRWYNLFNLIKVWIEFMNIKFST